MLIIWEIIILIILFLCYNPTPASHGLWCPGLDPSSWPTPTGWSAVVTEREGTAAAMESKIHLFKSETKPGWSQGQEGQVAPCQPCSHHPEPLAYGASSPSSCDSSTGTRKFILSSRSWPSASPGKQRKGLFKAKCLAKQILPGLLGFIFF